MRISAPGTIRQPADLQRQKKLQEAAEGFEAIFIEKLLKEAMPEENDGDRLLFGESRAMDLYKSMHRTAMAEEMAAAGGMGLARSIVDQYRDLSRSEVMNTKVVDGNFRISSPFGFRSDPFTGTKRFHYGIDLAAPEGSGVRSPVEGEIIFAGEQNGYGNCIKVRGEDEKVYLFAHLRDVNVREGQTVEAGASLGTVGSTGRSTGPHLHFEVRDGEGKAVDPGKLYRFQ